jgi:hypothetical protein
MASGRASVLPRVSNGGDSIAVSTVPVEVQPVTILVVVPPLRFLPTLLPTVISTIVATFFTAILTAIVTIRVAGHPTVISITSDFTVFQIGIPGPPRAAASLFLLLQFVLLHEVTEHPLQPLS